MINQIMMIDPGHGGNDPGAIGTTGVLEKDLNMQLANRIWSLTANYMQVLKTREAMMYKQVSLEKRVRIAKTHEPDYFISIHHNSFPDPNVRGLEIFYKEGCKESQNLAAVIYRNIHEVAAKITGYCFNVRGVKRNNKLYVLRKNPFPAVLVECGFLSNPEECKYVESPEGQMSLAYGIAMAMLEVN